MATQEEFDIWARVSWGALTKETGLAEFGGVNRKKEPKGCALKYIWVSQTQRLLFKVCVNDMVRRGVHTSGSSGQLSCAFDQF